MLEELLWLDDFVFQGLLEIVRQVQQIAVIRDQETDLARGIRRSTPEKR